MELNEIPPASVIHRETLDFLHGPSQHGFSQNLETGCHNWLYIQVFLGDFNHKHVQIYQNKA